MPSEARLPSSHGVWQLGVAVLLLALMSLLFANISTMYLARNYNTQTCLDAALVGAHAASHGADEELIAQVVQTAISRSSCGGFFISQARLHGVSLHVINENPCLIVNTVTVARLPAPALVVGGEALADGCILFSKTCVVSLTNTPKSNAQKLKRT